MSQEKIALRFISLFYLVMALAGLGLILWRAEHLSANPLAPPNETWPVALALTILITAATHLLSRFAYKKLPSLRHGTADIRRIFGNLNTSQIATIALASGIGEEILFRGWLYHETGLFISSIIFGTIHFPPNRRWLYWPFFATAMGFIFGWLQGWSGSLIFPIILHVGVNFLNLRLAWLPTKQPAN